MSEDINVGAISEALNNKLDLDGNNKVIPNGLTSIGFPSNRSIDLSLGATGTAYTAPANGWYLLARIATTSGQRITMVQGNENNRTYNITCYSSGSDQYIATCMPIKKGAVAHIYYDGGTFNYFRFVYAEGNQN